jgi:hypothetical protein
MLKKNDGIRQRDVCLALTFLLLLLWLLFKQTFFVYAAMLLLLLGMCAPGAMAPFAVVWFGLARILGSVMSFVLLTLVYVVILLPVAIVRRCMGKDAMNLKLWKNGKGSCLVEREHVFTPEDFTHPY